MSVLCNDLHTENGAVLHCALRPHTLGDHSTNSINPLTWGQHRTVQARWIKRYDGAFMWHAALTSKTTQCGLSIEGLTTDSIKGRTRAHAPIDAMCCFSCTAITTA